MNEAQRCDLKSLIGILNDPANTAVVYTLARMTGKSYSLVLGIKKGVASPRYSTVRKLLAACEYI